MISLLLAIIYLSFISLGLPDGLLGAAWPTMCVEMNVPVSYAGMISWTICAGTILSSLLSDRLTLRFGPAKVTAVSVAMTALALLGFSVTKNYWLLFVWAVPYGLGAGSVDASLNNYVALHFASRHMSWLHCMWGLGASVGPYIMGLALSGGMGWNTGYRYVAILQMVLTAVLFVSIPIWKNRKGELNAEKDARSEPLSLRQILAIPGAREVLVAFFCYCSLEGTAMLWGSSYLVRQLGIHEEQAASMASLFYLGMTGGRFVSGFLTMKINDSNMIRLGQSIIAIGAVVMILPLGQMAAFVGLLLIGLGCAPIYPCIIHSTPDHFGAENSQALIGVQMASAYTGALLIPPLFGLIADHITMALMPFYIGTILVLMVIMCEILNRKSIHKSI